MIKYIFCTGLLTQKPLEILLVFDFALSKVRIPVKQGRSAPELPFLEESPWIFSEPCQ